MGREDYPAAKLVNAMAWGFGGIFLVGMGCLCGVSIPAWVLGARVTALFHNFIPVKFSRGLTVDLSKRRGIWNRAFEPCYMGNEKDVLAVVFSCQNEHDREGSGLTIINS